MSNPHDRLAGLAPDRLDQLAALPAPAEVLAYVATHEPVAAQAVADGLGVPWESRTTVRNRLHDLVAAGELIVDDSRRPMLFAVNQLGLGAGEVAHEQLPIELARAAAERAGVDPSIVREGPDGSVIIDLPLRPPG